MRILMKIILIALLFNFTILCKSDSNADDLSSLSDDFSNSETLTNWKRFDVVENWPNRIEKIDINQTSSGHLYLVPLSSAWWRGYHGVFLFKEITGDFIITSRLKVTGKSTEKPKNRWTISGIMARTPGDTSLVPDKRVENWIYIMTGTGPNNEWAIDSKSTINSANEYTVFPGQSGWIELRIVRIGHVFITLYRPDGKQWVVGNRFSRPDMPSCLQVGINATSDFELSLSMSFWNYNKELLHVERPLDNIALFDYVNYSRPGNGRILLDKFKKGLFEVSNDELLMYFGGNIN